MAPSLRGVGAATFPSGNSVSTPTTLNPPLGPYVVGDTLVCLTTCRSGTPTVATPSGWTEVVNVAGTNGRLAIFTKRALTGSESAPAVTWSGLTTGNSGTPPGAQCATMVGAHSAVDVAGTVANGTASTATSVGGTALTTLTNGAIVLAATTRLDDAGTFTAPGGFAMVGQGGTTHGSDMALAWAWQEKVTAGSVSAPSFGLSGASSFASSGVMVALVPINVLSVSDSGSGNDDDAAEAPRVFSTVSDSGVGTDEASVVTPSNSDLPVQTNIWAHYRADNLGLADLDPVAAFPSGFAAGDDLAQATSGLRPIFRTGRVNGLPALVFDGGDWLRATTGRIFKPVTLLAVVKHTVASPSVEATIVGNGAGGGGQWRVATDFDVEYMEQGVQRIATSTDATKRVVVDEWCVLSFTYDASGNYEFRKNGEVAGSGTFDTTLTSGAITLAAYGVATAEAEFFTGEIAEAAVFSAVLGSTDLASNNAHLVSKYGLGGNVAKSASDSGSGTDAVSAVGRVLTEAGSGADAATPAALPAAVSDSGTGADTAVPARVVADTAVGTDQVEAQGRASADTAVGADAVTARAATAADTAAGTDLGALARVVTDDGAGTDLVGAQGRGSGDSGAGSDAVGALAGTTSDSGSGSDAATGGAALTSADTGSGADAVTTQGRAGSDSGAATDAAGALARSSGDTGSGSDAEGVARALSDSGSGSDASTLAATATGSDSGSGADDASVSIGVTNKADSDAGSGSDAVAAMARAEVESGTGSDGVGAQGRAMADTGSGTDLVGAQGRSGGDSGTGGDLVGGAGRSGAEAGSGADAGVTTAALVGSEAAAGADAASVAAGLTVADAAEGSDQASLESGSDKVVADSGSGADAVGALERVAGEAGAGSDGGTVGAASTSADGGSGSDQANLGAALAAEDSGSGSEAASTSAWFVTVDTAAGVELVVALGRGVGDAGVGLDAVVLTLPDAGSGIGSAAGTVTVQGSVSVSVVASPQSTGAVSTIGSVVTTVEPR